MRLSHDWRRGTAAFDDENLMSSAGLVPVMALAEQTGLPDLLEQRVVFRSERIRSGAANEELLTGVRRLARNLADKRALRDGLTVEKAADILWMFGIGVIYDALVKHRHWTPRELETWVNASLDQLILAPTNVDF